MKMLKRLENWFIRANQTLVALTMFLMFLLVFANVIGRYVFKFSPTWIDEMARFLMIWTVFLGIGLAMREGRHVAIELLQDFMPKKVRRYFRVSVGLIILLFLGILVVLGYQYALGTMEILSPVLRLPLGLVYMVVPLGALIFILHFLTIFSDFIDTSAEKELVAEILDLADQAEREVSKP